MTRFGHTDRADDHHVRHGVVLGDIERRQWVGQTVSEYPWAIRGVPSEVVFPLTPPPHTHTHTHTPLNANLKIHENIRETHPTPN